MGKGSMLHCTWGVLQGSKEAWLKQAKRADLEASKDHVLLEFEKCVQGT